MVLRIISAVMDKPTERYLADSELAGFGEWVMGDIDAALAAIADLDPLGGAEAGRTAGKLADLVVVRVLEMETCIDLAREHGWGKRIVKQRASLASVVEGRLREAEKTVLDALPTHTHAMRHQKGRRTTPKLGGPPDPALATRAITLLAFTDELRSSANYGGFSATRAKVVEKLGEYLDRYVEEILDLIRADEAEDVESATAFLNLAADFSQLVQGDKAAELIRRRAVAATQPDSMAEQA
jgi:hypothetical protein